MVAILVRRYKILIGDLHQPTQWLISSSGLNHQNIWFFIRFSQKNRLKNSTASLAVLWRGSRRDDTFSTLQQFLGIFKKNYQLTSTNLIRYIQRCQLSSNHNIVSNKIKIPISWENRMCQNFFFSQSETFNIASRICYLFLRLNLSYPLLSSNVEFFQLPTEF